MKGVEKPVQSPGKMAPGQIGSSQDTGRRRKKRPLLIKVREWFSHLFVGSSDTGVEDGFLQAVTSSLTAILVPKKTTNLFIEIVTK
jgi:hypothetical protein